MPRPAWSDKRERQYEHVKISLEQQGKSEETAEEIAARTVDKERARHGEARTAGAASTGGVSAARRGGLRPHQGAGERTVKQLRAEASKANVPGRSTMNRAELEKALKRGA